MSKFKWEGLDEERNEQEQDYIMRKLWSVGSVAMWPEKFTDLIAASTWCLNTINMFDLPETVNLINERGVSTAIIPETTQVVNKDVALIWAQPNHKPIQDMVNYYIDRIVQVEMVINTNLQLQKMPWLVGVSEEDKLKFNDIMRRIFNNEIVVYGDFEELQKIQTIATNTPYIIDNLVIYKRGLEHDLMTFLGINNNDVGTLEQTHVVSDAINANNQVIEDSKDCIISTISQGLNRFNKLFNRSVKISIKEEVKDDKLHNASDNQQ